MERGSRIMLGLGVSITSQIQSGSCVLFLYGLLLILNSVGSWTLVKPDAMPSAFFFGNNSNEQDERKDFIKRLDFYKREADLIKDNSFGFTVLLLLYYLHLLFVGT